MKKIREKCTSWGRRGVMMVLMMLMMVMMCGTTARADAGPKASIKVKIKNAPEDYHLALLDQYVKEDRTNSELHFDGEYTKENVKEYLNNFYYDGWHEHSSFISLDHMLLDRKDTAYFGYMVPEYFRVLIVCSDGTVQMSNPIERKEFNSTCVYDYKSNTLRETRAEKMYMRFVYIFLCYLLTAVAELFAMKIWKFPFTKQNIMHFFIINTITQFLLNFTIVNMIGEFLYLIAYIFLEIFIMILEGAYYIFTLKSFDGKIHPAKNFLYGVTANIFSVLCEFAIVICVFFGLTFFCAFVDIIDSIIH